MEENLNNNNISNIFFKEIPSKDKIEMDFLISIISSVITNIILENCGINENEKKIIPTIFDSKKIPKISIEDYLKRIAKFTEIEESTLIIICIYLDNLNEKKIYLTWSNIHR